MLFLQNGFDKYYKKQNSYPIFKKKGVKESYRTNNVVNNYKDKRYESIKLDLSKNIIVLPKLKKVKLRGYRHLATIDGRILNATIRQVGYKYYVSICVEEDIILPEKQENTFVGIDVGVKDLVITSNNEVYENARKKYVEKVVAKITSANDIIVTENLKVKSMLKKKKEKNNAKTLRKGITNATFGQILRKLEEKCQRLNKTLSKLIHIIQVVRSVVGVIVLIKK